MHDLNAINRLNQEAFAKSIHHFRAQGRFVLARYDGLHLTSVETFGELTHAQWALELTPANPAQGERAVIFTPVPAYAAAARDQSEDRKVSFTVEELAAFGNSSPSEQTLAQYINRKST